MPSELGLLSEGLCYLGLSRDYSLQSSLSPAPLWLCAHTSAPSLELADNSEPQFSGYYQTFTSSLCSLSARRNCPLVLCWESTWAGAVQWGELLLLAALGSSVQHCCFTLLLWEQ